MKRLLFLIMTVIVAASTYDYARSAGHYGLVVVMGVVLSLFLIGKTME
ncbi:hypothetical protein [Nocardia aurantiaca]|uniref:Uncharacterized protein n=1 Tax=Nocardia aurantiaca TaxID=2675850 RepID=A0A6I3L2F8_9NOCA|nr:hypothetical protein [Nocardia aurantiaca]MTE14059.1 hypothetical protein [Nocardia aurantiaca]